jgi:hypothetical protein
MKIVFITAKNINLGLESLDFLYIIDPNPMLRNSSLLRRERNG